MPAPPDLRRDADAALADRDPDIPGLLTVLDGDRLGQRLRRALPDAGITLVDLGYVRYKPGTSMVTACRVHTRDGVVHASAKAFAVGDEAKAAKALEKAAVPVIGDAGAVGLDPGVVVVFLPNDDDLPAVARLCDETRRRRLLRRAVPDRPDVYRAPLEMLRHKPNRRWVARLGKKALVKVHAADDFRRAAAATAALAGARLPVAPPLGADERARVVVTEWVSGTALDVALAADAVSPRVHAEVGAALARLHALTAPSLPPADDRAAVSAACAAVSALCPDLARDVAAAADGALARLAEADVTAGTRHGDFSTDQVVLTGDGAPVIVDLDNAERGDPVADLALYALDLDATATAALLDGYRSAAGADPMGRMAAHRTAWHLRRAAEPFRLRVDDWPAQVAARVRAALDSSP